MKDVALKEKIDSLPDDLKKQVSDYVDFLLYQYGDSKAVLTDEEKTELDKRWEAYQQDTSSSSKLEDVKERLEKKYGLSN
ncbi:DUF2281 domain-containing protein [Catalinimonas sp. 4WD22]|uniref:DUF2281 domain-containing protein n=1 Tax=Catalinimonas locisalis TaxID=3133978 RepID=UPI003100BDE5